MVLNVHVIHDTGGSEVGGVGEGIWIPGGGAEKGVRDEWGRAKECIEKGAREAGEKV
jgi:hypothetical protein